MGFGKVSENTGDEVMDRSKHEIVWGIIFYSALILVSLGAAVYIAWCVKYAPWGFSDSAAYFAAARNFAAGHGLGIFNPDGTFTYLVHYPPLYSLFLSLFVILKIDLILINQISDVLFFALFVFLNGYLFYRITNSKFAGICLSIISASSISLATDFTSMMSEPMAFVTGFPGFLLLLLFIKEKKPAYLYISAILCGLSFAARYAFFAFPLAGVIVLLIFSRDVWKKRLRNAAIFVGLSAGPMIIWSIAQYTAGTTIGARHLMAMDNLWTRVVETAKQSFNIIKYWLPFKSNMLLGVNADIVRPVLLVFLILLVGVAFVIGLKQRRSDDQGRQDFRVVAGSIILAISYLVVFYFSYLFLSQVGLDDRLISPLLPMIFILLLGSAVMIGRIIRKNYVSIILGSFLVICFFGYNYSNLRKYSIMSSTYPDGYASPVWKGQKIWEIVSHLPSEIPLISNAPDITLFYSNRNGYFLTHQLVVDPKADRFENGMDLTELLEQRCALLVLFNPVEANHYENRPDPISEDDFQIISQKYLLLYSDSIGRILQSSRCHVIPIQ